MLNEKQLERAVERGIITDDQRSSLLELVATETDKDRMVAFDEAPRFFRSFNDLFIGLGVGLLAGAVASTAKLFTGLEKEASIFVPLFGMLVFWGMAEWLTRMRRINFPSIVIVVAFAIFVGQFATNFWEYFALQTESLGSEARIQKQLGAFIVSAFATVSLYAFFYRFRLPFAILLLAGACCLTVITGLTFMMGGAKALEPFLRWIVLGIGLAVFAGAMWFDTQDPLRTKRTSDHGFWLHLLAAPIITHSALWTTLQPIMKNMKSTVYADDVVVGIVLSIFIVFSLIALIIDRRALLISSLGYASAALTYIIVKFDVGANVALVLTLLLIATLVLVLGTGWHKLRAKLFGLLPAFAFYKKLPPVKV